MADRYVVVGNPIAHSKSPQIHAAFAAQTGQNLSYERLLAPLDGFVASVEAFRAEGGKGLNVTVPFKQEAWQLCDAVVRTRAAGRSGQHHQVRGWPDHVGDNTDGIGLCRDICHNLQQALQGKRILLLGAGGAARGVILPLLAEQPACLTIANRTASKAEQLAQRFQHYGQLGASSYEALAGQQFDVIINATSASLSDALPPLPGGCFAPGSLAYDMMYGKGLTPFLLFAQQQGAAQLADGLGMLVEQAAEAFCIWRGVRPDTTAVIAELRAGLC
jgi:shikimate dehydrogenase